MGEDVIAPVEQSIEEDLSTIRAGSNRRFFKGSWFVCLRNPYRAGVEAEERQSNRARDTFGE